jgi:hypothetical protein
MKKLKAVSLVIYTLFLFMSCGFSVEDSILNGPGAGGANIQWATGHFTGGTTTTAPSSSTNLNQSTAYSLQWTANSMDTDFFSHSTSSNNHQIRVLQDGDYLVSLTLPSSSAIERSAIRSRIRVNGAQVLGTTSESSYARNLDDHFEASNHVVRLLNNLQSGSTIDITVQQGANTGTVTTFGQAALYIEYIGDQRYTFSGTSTQTTNGTDLNTGTAFPLEWSSETSSSTFTHSDSSSPEDITLNQDGSYLVFVNIPIASTVQRANIRALISIYGTTVSGMEAKQGYIRADAPTLHFDSSVHYSGLITGASSGDILSVRIQQESENGTVNLQTGERASIFVEFIDDTTKVFSAEATVLSGGSNWNPSSAQDILWQTVSTIDTTRYTHSTSTNSQNITLSQGGDFLLIYSDSVTSTAQRAANLIQLEINGTPISGALNATHYMRNGSQHNESSGTLVYFISNASPGDVISLSSIEDGLAGTINDDGPARLTIWDRSPE